VELSFGRLGLLREGGALEDLLARRRELILEAAPPAALLRALRDEDSGLLPPWLLRSEEAELALLRALASRLSRPGGTGAEAFADPFTCLDVLVRRGNVPTAFLESLCAWSRRMLRRFGNPSTAPTAAQLCVQGAPRHDLDLAIRALVVFGGPREGGRAGAGAPGALDAADAADGGSGGSASERADKECGAGAVRRLGGRRPARVAA
ncbi:unnamed protein product, partial [Prorocentrum cordatum]